MAASALYATLFIGAQRKWAENQWYLFLTFSQFRKTLALSLTEVIHLADILKHDLLLSFFGTWREERFQRLDVVISVIGMWKVAGPEEFVIADVFDDVGKRTFIRVGRNPALAIKVKAGFFLKLGRRF
tara:strand:+ start:271 stop:654 length:384 start_codon:yes stop_codon:yes gene_type:complete